MELVYEYLTGPHFRQRVQAIVESFTSMNDDLVRELPVNMIPAGIRPIRKETRLPHLADAEIALIKRDELPKAAEMFAEQIVHSLESKNL